MAFSLGSFKCCPLLPVGIHEHRSLPLARWSVACRGTPIQSRCLLPARRCLRFQATTTCIAEVAPPKLAGFADVQSEEQFKAVLKAGVAAKKIPEQLVPGFLDFYNNYKSVHLHLSSNSNVPQDVHALQCPMATYMLLTSPLKTAFWSSKKPPCGIAMEGALVCHQFTAYLDCGPYFAAAVVNSGVPGADERRVAQVMGAIADRVCDQLVNPYTFPSFHQRILEPYNYYQFGQVRHIAQDAGTPAQSIWMCLMRFGSIQKHSERQVNMPDMLAGNC